MDFMASPGAREWRAEPNGSKLTVADTVAVPSPIGPYSPNGNSSLHADTAMHRTNARKRRDRAACILWVTVFIIISFINRMRYLISIQPETRVKIYTAVWHEYNLKCDVVLVLKEYIDYHMGVSWQVISRSGMEDSCSLHWMGRHASITPSVDIVVL